MSNSSDFQLSSFLRFSADVRASSRARLQDADQRIAAAHDRIERSKHEVAEPLQQLDATRLATYERSMAPIHELHRGGNTLMPGERPRSGQTERFLGSAPASAPRAGLATAARGIAGAALLAVVVAAAVYGVELALKLQFSLSLPAAIGLAIVLATLLSMRVTYRVEQWNARVVDAYAFQAKEFETAAEQFATQAGWLAESSKEAGQTIEQVASHADAAVARLEPVVMDAANAAVLLRNVLDMALLDGEGALVPDILGHLTERKAQIHALGKQIEARPALIAA